MTIGGDVDVNLKCCRLVAKRLADHDSLNETTHDRHQLALRLFVGVVVGEEEESPDQQIRLIRNELRLKFCDLLREIPDGLIPTRKF